MAWLLKEYNWKLINHWLKWKKKKEKKRRVQRTCILILGVKGLRTCKYHTLVQSLFKCLICILYISMVWKRFKHLAWLLFLTRIGSKSPASWKTVLVFYGFSVYTESHHTCLFLTECGLAPSVVEPTQDGWKGAEEVSWPWTALIHFGIFGDIEGCMGTLIDREWVITTSHCVSLGQTPLNPKSTKVQVGVYERSSHGSQPKLHDVQEIITHKDFNPDLSKLHSNIALVHLAKPINVTNEIRPICLPTRQEIQFILQPGVVRKGVVIGWGKMENHRVQSTLKQAQVNVVHYHHCNWANRFYDPKKMICAGYKTTSTCMSDSGSPIMFPVNHPQASRKWVLGGLLSWGLSTLPTGCHKDYGYSAYINIGRQLKWIKNKMKSPSTR